MGADTNFISPEALVRLWFFASIFFVMALIEKIAPQRILLKSKFKRWVNNIGMQIIDVVVLRLIFLVFPFGVAVICAQRGWGLLNYCHTIQPLALFIGILAFNGIHTSRHRLSNRSPFGTWRA